MESKYYQTFCGGTLSILALLLILFFSSTELKSFFDGNQFNESVLTENLNYANTQEYTVDDNQAMIAFQFVENQDYSQDALSQIDSYLSYYFVLIEKTNDVQSKEVVKAVECTGKYHSH